MRIRGGRFASLALAVLLGIVPAAGNAEGQGAEVAPGLRVGDVLEQSNAQLAKDLLPPEILKHYESGDYRNPIVTYPAETGGWEKAFLAATEKNRTTLDVDANGTIIEKATGKQAPYYYGLPFPDIDAADPSAAVKIAWNQFLSYWAGGSSYNRASVVMLNRRGVDREIIADGWFLFFDGQAEKYRMPNPLNLQSQFLGVALKPADLQGTGSLTWRYRDPAKRDSVWAFVPALRRVRAVSPANRSDGYLGSDISGDDGFFFDGKPEDFTWKLVGKREGLRFVDPEAIGKELPAPVLPGGGYEVLTDRNSPTVGFRKRDWKGISWAPVDAGLAKRSLWVIEAIPRDKYYLYGRIELWIDSITWDGAFNRKFSWTGELVGDYQLLARINHPAGDKNDPEWMPIATQAWACAENVKMDRATVSAIRPDPAAAFHRRTPLQASLFDSTTMARFGK